MVEVADTEEHVVFEGEESSSATDDEPEQHEVEVTFEPGKSHRRKSSIDVFHVAMPLLRRPTQETECIVHQLLDTERSQDAAESEASGASTARSPDKNTHQAPPSAYHHNHRQEGAQRDSLATVREDAPEPSVSPRPSGADGMAEPRRSDAGLGQFDEQAWRSEMLHSVISCSDMEGSDAPSRTAQEALQSRLLTKKQLSDMAWGVRELSRRLSSIRLKPKVRSLFILTKIYDGALVPRTKEVVRWLLSSERDRRLTVYVEDRLREDKEFDAEGLIAAAADEYAAKNNVEPGAARDKVARQLRYWDAELCRTKPHAFDFIVTLGGDGTVLYASWLFQGIVPPVISFSLGSLGFMTKFDFADFRPTLTSAFSQGVTVSLRLRFEGTVMRSVARKALGEGAGAGAEEGFRRRDLVDELVGEENEDELTHRPDGTFHVLNEIVVDRGPNPTLSNMELFGDDEHFTSILADGICVSTPTGSTAYNLAAGGSLCHPENPIMLVTSVAPHTLSFRPIILPDTIVLRVGVPYDSRTSSWASFDGRERVELHPGDYVTISASRYPFATVQAGGRRSEDWMGSICGKLGWNRRQKQKGGFKEWDGR